MEQKFYEYEQSFKEIIEKLIERNDKQWKGFITMNGPLVENPDILFIGINPGPGLFNEKGKTPFRVSESYSENFPFDKEAFAYKTLKYRDDNTFELDYFTDGNYNDKIWYNGNFKKSNSYVRNIVKIISNVAELTTGEKFIKGELPKWYNGVGGRVMAMNINPIATENTSDLKFLMKNIKADNWKNFIEPLRVLVRDTIKPKTIVFLGMGAYRDFIREEEHNSDTVFQIPYFAVSRKLGWNDKENLYNIASDIAKHLK